MANSSPRTLGKVYLVGAGPGDPGLITVRGVECLQRADVVLYDYLANPALLGHAPQAQHVCLGQHGRTRIWSQEEVNAELVRRAHAGECVVRLKGGDPAVFARGAEEAEYLVHHGVPYEVVPGITAAIAASSYASIPLTHRDHASAVAFVTGQGRGDRRTDALDYAILAQFPGTLVFYMGVTTAPHWAERLLAGGKSPDTPVALVRRCSLPDQRTVISTLGELATRLEAEHIRPPVVMIVGAVVQLASTLRWFEQRPLFGQRVLVTRPLEQAAALAEPLQELGAEVLVQPAIQIGPPASWEAVDACLARLESFDWIAFSSANGVRSFLERLLGSGRDLRALSGVRLAVIGPGTAAELARFHLRPDLQPDAYVAEALADALVTEAAGRRVLLVRASRGREVLSERLSDAGALVEQVVAYSSTDIERPDPAISEAMLAHRVDWVTVTSSAIAQSLVRLYGSALHCTKLVSISPITSATLRQLGHEPATEALEQTMASVVEAILAASRPAR